MTQTKAGSGVLGKAVVACAALVLVAYVATHWPTNPGKNTGARNYPAASIDAAPLPIEVKPLPQKPTPSGTKRGTLFYVAGWGKTPPAIVYTIAGQNHWKYPQEQGPWQWQSDPIVPVSGTDYFMQVGATFGDYGVIFCRIEVDGIIVDEGPGRRDTSKDPGAIRCRYHAP